MRENRTSGSEGREFETNRTSLPYSVRNNDPLRKRLAFLCHRRGCYSGKGEFRERRGDNLRQEL